MLKYNFQGNTIDIILTIMKDNMFHKIHIKKTMHSKLEFVLSDFGNIIF